MNVENALNELIEYKENLKLSKEDIQKQKEDNVIKLQNEVTDLYSNRSELETKKWVATAEQLEDIRIKQANINEILETKERLLKFAENKVLIFEEPEPENIENTDVYQNYIVAKESRLIEIKALQKAITSKVSILGNELLTLKEEQKQILGGNYNVG